MSACARYFRGDGKGSAWRYFANCGGFLRWTDSWCRHVNRHRHEITEHMLLPLAESNLILALLLLMVSTIILGMGLPSSVCYLLMATLVGPVLADLGIVPLAAHLFIFYFGMMSMVTPPVALAAYTAGAIAEAGIMQTGFAAFRFAWVGFALPYAFVLRPELLLLTPDGGSAGLLAVGTNVLVTVFGIVALAASVSGYALRPLNIWYRLILLTAAMVLFLAQSVWLLVAAAITVLGLGIFNWHNKKLNAQGAERQRRREDKKKSERKGAGKIRI